MAFLIIVLLRSTLLNRGRCVAANYIASQPGEAELHSPPLHFLLEEEVLIHSRKSLGTGVVLFCVTADIQEMVVLLVCSTNKEKTPN